MTIVVLSGFQRYFCMQYTTQHRRYVVAETLFYQDFKDTFVCNTQLQKWRLEMILSCFIRISKILLYAIHNTANTNPHRLSVVLSGFQRYFCMQYTTDHEKEHLRLLLFYQDFKDTFVCNTQPRS